ncbi:MAG: hypothetical protein QF578_17920 [Alphaproteobacteria bacterium]|nr:hypothetical protein [Alphaproteobacteria bacterium]MDP6814232.1 hypothetical protein [Alphaproteobacteria bacterium]
MGRSDAEEIFCDTFANALLIPPGFVAQHKPTPKAIFELSRRFDVSIEAAGRALARSNPGISVIGLRPTPYEDQCISTIEVLWSAGTTIKAAEMKLGSRWTDFAKIDNNTEQLLDLGEPHHAIRAIIAKWSQSYCVAVFSNNA